jgi:hypothetical protein
LAESFVSGGRQGQTWVLGFSSVIIVVRVKTCMARDTAAWQSEREENSLAMCVIVTLRFSSSKWPMPDVAADRPDVWLTANGKPTT